jgi:acyl-CoA thioester hydrolase
MEHTRHEFLLSIGISFADMSAAGYDFVVSKVTLNYKAPLRSRDEFRSQVYVTREGIKCVFHQEIIRVSDNKVCLRGTVESVCIHNGKLVRSTPYDSILEGHLKEQ